IDLVREVPFGAAFRSNVDRPPGDRVALEGLADRVQILRLTGFVFFGTARGLLERIGKRAEASPMRFLVIDLRRVTGVDASGVFVVESGRLRVEWVTPDGTRMRLNTVRPGVMVGEVALYTGLPRTADVIAEVQSVVLALSRASIERLEAEEPERAAVLHRWLAT